MSLFILTNMVASDDYKQFEGSPPRVLEVGRYLVGLFSGRIYDTDARKLCSEAIVLSESPVRYMRHLEVTRPEKITTCKPWKVTLNDPTPNAGTNHCISLHRLILSLANYLEITVFNEGTLERLGIEFPSGRTYDNTIAFRPYQNKKFARSVMTALRVSKRHSKQCDGDHRLGYFYLYCHALGHCQATSHRMNSCFNHVRKKAGHWCFGLLLSEYTAGHVTNDVDTTFFDKVTLDEGRVLFDGSTIKETDLFDLLPMNDDWFTGGADVDCYCNDTERCKDGKCFVCCYNEDDCFCDDLAGDVKCWVCQDKEIENDDDDNA